MYIWLEYFLDISVLTISLLATTMKAFQIAICMYVHVNAKHVTSLWEKEVPCGYVECDDYVHYFSWSYDAHNPDTDDLAT